MQRFGAKYGVGALAQQITSDSATAGPALPIPRRASRSSTCAKIRRLSSALAAEYARQNKTELEQALGRPAGNADLYMAHFLGAGGATTFLKAVASGGATPGAALLPEAAAANRAAFYDAGGHPLSVAQIYQSFASKIGQQATELAASAGPGPIAALGGGSDVPALIRGLTFDGRQLASPMAAMLNLFALSAIKLIGSPSTPSASTLLPGLQPL